MYKTHTEYKNSLIGIDIVSSIPYVNLDYQKIDYAFFSVQKGFGLPAGLGVLVISPRAYDRVIELKKTDKEEGSYHKLSTLIEYAQKSQTPETPNVLGIYLFNKILIDMLEKGITSIRKETEKKAAMLYEVLLSYEDFSPVVQNPYRSQTVLVANHKQPKSLIHFLKEKGIVISGGLWCKQSKPNTNSKFSSSYDRRYGETY